MCRKKCHRVTSCHSSLSAALSAGSHLISGRVMSQIIGRLFADNRELEVKGEKYRVVGYLSEGFTGQVYRATDGRREYAIKLFLPIFRLHTRGYVSDSAIPELNSLQKTEYEFIGKLSHPNVVRVYGADQVRLNQDELDILKTFNVKNIDNVPIIVLEFIDGISLSKLLADDRYKLRASQLTNILIRTALAVEYVNASRQMLHCDIKADNVMVRSVDYEPVLIDFALCKNLNFDEVEQDGVTKLAVDWGLIPALPETHPIHKMIVTGEKRSFIKEEIFPHLDVFQFGKMLESICDKASRIYGDAEFEYLRTLSTRLTNWTTVRSMKLGQLSNFVRRLDFSNADGAGDSAVNKQTYDSIVTLPNETSIVLSPVLTSITKNPSWRRLFAINQLSLLPLVFQGSGYPRSVHVLYSYELARRFVKQLNTNSIFRYLFGQEEVDQLFISTLLHDINHFPFLHIFQELGIEEVKKATYVYLFCNGELTGKPSLYELAHNSGIDADRLRRLTIGRHFEQPDDVDAIMNSILNSGVDVDKLSYLKLDAYFSGVPYGNGINLSEIIGECTVALVGDERSSRPHLAFREQAIEALESAVLTRYWNFRALYWEQRNRAAMAMLLRTVRKLFAHNFLTLHKYLENTLWSGDIGALNYLESIFYQSFKKKSIIQSLISDEAARYVAAYTLKTSRQDAPDTVLYERLKSLTQAQELEVARGIAMELENTYRSTLGIVDEDEVLVDIPRRPLDDGGGVYIVDKNGRGHPLSDYSEPVRSIARNYERLTKQIRVFVSPRIIKHIGQSTDGPDTIDGRWRAIVSSAVQAVSRPGEIEV